MIVKFKNGSSLPCISCSYIANKDTMIQISMNTAINHITYADILSLLNDADFSEIKAYANDMLTGIYYGYDKFDLQVTALANLSLDVIINLKQGSLQEKVRQMETSASDTILRVETLENMNLIDIDKMSLEEYKNYRQKENKQALADFLEKSHVIHNGKSYGVSYEDQMEMLMNLMTYNLFQESSLSAKKELIELAVLIKAFVYPYLQHCQSIRTAIFACTDKESLRRITIDYDNFVTTNEGE